ncbi:hypothetical protein H261_04750 [Paramagnetospirillum caucaseum]|uniref:Uncharacterized protein n=1 Tax=Paramagnetospirillum caucaseum TaxID=1244869 RepID=M3AEG6_9PROT|nr:hypothetical protein [Paramagnetospirillum caucaseum]EME71218.1 hypothetical protein H261_04750 [Paramagnetospirillum caucaseum]
MAFDLDKFRAGFGATMARIRSQLDEFDRARDEMHRRIQAFCAT